MIMKLLKNESGVALVMVIIIALIGLVMVSTLLFMVTQGTRISGAQRVFRSADEAGLGGAQIATQIIKDNVFNAKQPGNSLVPITSGVLSVAFYNNDTSDQCVKQKLMFPRGTWATSNPQAYNPLAYDPTAYYWPACAGARATTIDAFTSPPSEDFKFDLPGASPGQTFTVYAKIIDTVKGNTEEGGIGGKLGGAGVVSSMEGEITPLASPSLYRIEVQAQDATNPQQRSKYSVLYAH